MSQKNKKSIFITGAASGIGRATAMHFAEAGWFVGCFDLNPSGLKSLSEEIGAANGMFEVLDVTDRTEVQAMLESFYGAAGDRLDILYNNAGIDAKGEFAQQPFETIEKVLSVNLTAGLGLIHAAIPYLKKTENALCLSTASASAIFGAGGLAIYSATKHAIKGLTEALSVELAASGVRCSDILPGIIDTGMLAPEVKELLPKEGMWRVLAPSAVAETAMKAYEGNQVHYYAPEELKDRDIEVTQNPEQARDDQLAGRMF